ncbi:MAG: hypothetical protein K2W93_11565 [Burkholderiaceae bacterium]|nr:hypothetical protein [Burkholderiaceae bacterium]
MPKPVFNFARAGLQLASAICLVGLTACASTSSKPGKPGTDEQVTGAVTAPLQDLNLIQAKIPPVLLAAQEAPFKLPADESCAGLAQEKAALDQALGPDLDSPERQKLQRDLMQMGGDAASDAAVGALRSASENLIPFRGWVRKLSGAEKHSVAVTASLVAGQSRRSFLRGLQLGKACP